LTIGGKKAFYEVKTSITKSLQEHFSGEREEYAIGPPKPNKKQQKEKVKTKTRSGCEKRACLV